MSVQSEIKKLKAEKENMLAKMASAQARMRIQEQLEGLSVDAEVKALDNVREHIKNTRSRRPTSARSWARPTSTRGSRRCASTSGDVTAKQQLAELKAASAAQEGVGGKTM